MSSVRSLILAALLVSACSPGQADAAGPLRTIAVQPAELGLAEAAVLRDCLRGKGFDPPDPRPFIGGVMNVPRPVPEGGYDRWVDQDPTDAYRSTLPPDRQQEFDRAVVDVTGPEAEVVTPSGRAVQAPERGCVADARRAVYGSVRAWLTLVYVPQELNATAAELYHRGPVAEAITRYRACMNELGQPIEYPQDSMGLAERLPKQDRSRLAAADQACQERTQVVEHYLDALVSESGEWAEANADVLVDAAATTRDSVQRARAVLERV